MNSSSDILRCFIALYPDAAALENMAEVVDCLRERNRGFRWEKPSHVHITLKFLGDVRRSVVDRLAEDLREAVIGEPSFGARLDSVGGFPDLRRPRIVWIGFHERIEAIQRLHNAVESVCDRHALPIDEKEFTPHFTIGRIRRNSDIGDLENDIQSCSFQQIRAWFTSVKIMHSRLTPQGAVPYGNREHFITARNINRGIHL